MYIITLADLKNGFIKLAPGESFDDMLDILIRQVSARIQKYLNHYLEKAERTVYFNAGRKFYFLPAYPVDLTATLQVTDYDVEQVKDDDFFIDADTGQIEFWYETNYYKPNQIYVKWTGGYDVIDDSTDSDGSLSVPEEIKLATAMQVTHMFKRRDSIGLSRVVLPNGNININSALTLLPEVKELLNPYRATPSMR